MKRKANFLIIIASAAMLLCGIFQVDAQTSGFTFQGKLSESNLPANGTYLFQFKLFDNANTQIGATMSDLNATVTEGVFTVNLDFGANAFSGAPRQLEISVRRNANEPYVTLSPRQSVSSAPYAIRSATTALADDSTQLGGIDANQYVTGQVVKSLNNVSGPVTIAAGANVTITPSGNTLTIAATGGSGSGAISGITAGTGLIGGGSTGNVTVGIANGGVNTLQLADGGVTDAKIATVNGSKVTGTVANAATASNATQLGGVAANQYVQTSDPRLSDARSPSGGSPNYIQNGTMPQANSNFNIAGTGTANQFNAVAQFNIGANRVLSTPGIDNTFVGSDSGLANSSGARNSFMGFGAGRFNTLGNDNAFFGNRVGRDNTTGESNSFFGSTAGISNTVGSFNSFFGRSAGAANSAGESNSFFGHLSGSSNTTGGLNSFFGRSSGQSNTTGQWNSYFGGQSGLSNTSGSNNSFFGNFSGFQNTTGTGNAFFGLDAGRNNLDGDNNVFFGAGSGRATTTGGNNVFAGLFAGIANTTGSNNTILGANANTGSANLTNATAVGAGAVVSQSNSLVLGNNANVGIGTSSPTSKLTVAGLIETTTGGVKFPDGTIQTTASTGGGSGNFINNSTSLQSSANFNISGEGKANSFDATSRYELNGSRILSNAGTANLFVGLDTGASNTGSFNTFVGAAAGQNNTTGNENTFVGRGAGANNSTGSGNSFFGRGAGLNNTTAIQNSFFGIEAGLSNTTGISNSFFGAFAGRSNTDGTGNAFFGTGAGRNNLSGDSNVFLGFSSGFGNNGGSGNTFVGKSAGQANISGNSNTFLGGNAGAANLANDNTFLGNGAGVGNTTGGENTYVGRSAGGSGNGHQNVYVGMEAGFQNTSGQNNTFVGRSAGLNNTTGFSNVFIGKFAGINNTIGNNNTIIGANAQVTDESLGNATAIGAGSVVQNSNTIAMGRPSGVDKVVIYGLGTAGSTQLCRNSLNEISTCSSSLRYKQNISPFSSGMTFVNKLKPIEFDWKEGGLKDVGFGAEDIAKIDPRFAVFNDKGEVEGVKYDRLSVAFVNAIKEQDAIIRNSLQQIEVLQQNLAELRKMVYLKKRRSASRKGGSK